MLTWVTLQKGGCTSWEGRLPWKNLNEDTVSGEHGRKSFYRTSVHDKAHRYPKPSDIRNENTCISF